VHFQGTLNTSICNLQVSSLAELGLPRIPLQQRPAASDAAAKQSLPRELLHHALHGPAAGSPAAACLLPLDISNDAVAYCELNLQNDGLAHALALEASDLFDAMLSGISWEVTAEPSFSCTHEALDSCLL
jgi:hypothetical protein